MGAVALLGVILGSHKPEPLSAWAKYRGKHTFWLLTEQFRCENIAPLSQMLGSDLIHLGIRRGVFCSSLGGNLVIVLT